VDDADSLRAWIARAEDQVQHLAEAAEKAQRDLIEGRRQLMLLYERLAAVTNAPVPVSGQGMARARSTRERVQSDAEAILKEHGVPMHINQLLAEFVRRGLPLPGRGTPTNIVVHLTASDRFSRKGRGTYGLAEWDRPSHSASPPSPTSSGEMADAATDRATGLPGRQARGS